MPWIFSQRRVPNRALTLLAWCSALALLHASEGHAAPPELTGLFPAGGQRGVTTTLTQLGKAVGTSARLWAAGDDLTFESAGKPGTFTMKVAADAAPGVRLVRLVNEEGASAYRPLVIGTIEETNEKEPNDTAATAPVISQVALTINGRLEKAGDVDMFAVDLRQGQTLVASLDANRLLASPMDGVLQLADSSGTVVAQNDDDHGTDPRIVFVAARAGRYCVRVFAFPAVATANVGFSGGESFIYRLTLTTAGFVDYAWPLAVGIGGPDALELVGWTLPEAARHKPLAAFVDAKTLGKLQARGETHSFSVFDSAAAGAAQVLWVPNEAILERETNDASAQPVSLPVTISGRIERPGDIDSFEFSATKGEKIQVQVESRGLGFPLDPALKVTDVSGRSLATVDDSAGGRDAEASFTAAANARYRVSVRDFTTQGSTRHVYRLHIRAAQPDFSLSLPASSIVLTPGKPAEFTIDIDRRDGFAEEIALEAIGLPVEVTLEATKSLPKGDSAKTVRLRLATKSGAWSGAVRFEGVSPGRKPKRHLAQSAVTGTDLRSADVWLSIPSTKKSAK